MDTQMSTKRALSGDDQSGGPSRPKKSNFLFLHRFILYNTATDRIIPAPNKALYGHAKIAEQARRRFEHESDWVQHDRSTAETQKTFRMYSEQKQRFLQISADAEKRKAEILLESKAMDQRQVDMAKRLRELEEKFAEVAKQGEKDAMVSEKYRAFLDMETDSLGLKTWVYDEGEEAEE